MGLLMLAGLSACGVLPTAPRDWFLGATEYAALPAYRDWWGQLEECSGITSQALDDVRWFQRPDFDGALHGGISDWRTHRIVVRSNRIEDAGIIRHEMLHDLLQTSEHPQEYFQDRCAALVLH